MARSTMTGGTKISEQQERRIAAMWLSIKPRVEAQERAEKNRKRQAAKKGARLLAQLAELVEFDELIAEKAEATLSESQKEHLEFVVGTISRQLGFTWGDW